MRLIIILLLISSSVLYSAAQVKNTYAIKNVNLFNGFEDKIYPNAIVFVKAGKIDRVGNAGDKIDSEFEIIDGMGYYLMPSLIDAHSHLDNLAAAKRALETGVTTLRTAGVAAFQDVALSELAKTGRIAGPDIIPAGVYVTPNLEETILADTRLTPLIDGVKTDDELRLLVNVNIDRGAKVIKTRGTERAGRPDTDPREQVYTEKQIGVIVQEAGKRGVPVMIHAHGDEGARAAVLAGAKSIEHGTFLSDETLKLMKEKGTYLVPTFITLEDLTQPGGDYIGPVLELRGRFMMPQAESVIKKAYALGIKIVTGADNSYTTNPTSRISLECQHYVRIGMTNFDAIQSATQHAAALLGVEKITGRIEKGFEADMILIPGNPLQEIRYLQDALLVMSNGQVALKRIPFGK